jgi:hypothetical protein
MKMRREKISVVLCFLLAICLAACENATQINRSNDSQDIEEPAKDIHVPYSKENAKHDFKGTDGNNGVSDNQALPNKIENQQPASNTDSKPDNEQSKKLDYNPKREHITLPLIIQNPSDDDILSLYYQAARIEEMFENTYFSFDYDSSLDIGNNTYYKVVDDTYRSIADLAGLLKTIFSDYMTGILINNGRYYEADGELYTLWADKGGKIDVGESTYEIIKESAAKIIFRITTETFNNFWEKGSPLPEVIGYKTHDMILEYLDGEWLFTQFYIFGYYDSFDEFLVP